MKLMSYEPWLRIKEGRKMLSQDVGIAEKKKVGVVQKEESF